AEGEDLHRTGAVGLDRDDLVVAGPAGGDRVVEHRQVDPAGAVEVPTRHVPVLVGRVAGQQTGPGAGREGEPDDGRGIVRDVDLVAVGIERVVAVVAVRVEVDPAREVARVALDALAPGRPVGVVDDDDVVALAADLGVVDVRGRGDVTEDLVGGDVE